MSEMNERIARILCRQSGQDPDNEGIDQAGQSMGTAWTYFVGQAREIIGAMLNPTPEMYDAVSNSDVMYKDNNSTGIYRTMINGAME